jgi:hypothetical protein
MVTNMELDEKVTEYIGTTVRIKDAAGFFSPMSD